MRCVVALNDRVARRLRRSRSSPSRPPTPADRRRAQHRPDAAARGRQAGVAAQQQPGRRPPRAARARHRRRGARARASRRRRGSGSRPATGAGRGRDRDRLWPLDPRGDGVGAGGVRLRPPRRRRLGDRGNLRRARGRRVRRAGAAAAIDDARLRADLRPTRPRWVLRTATWSVANHRANVHAQELVELLRPLAPERRPPRRTRRWPAWCGSSGGGGSRPRSCGGYWPKSSASSKTRSARPRDVESRAERLRRAYESTLSWRVAQAPPSNARAHRSAAAPAARLAPDAQPRASSAPSTSPIELR